MHLETKISIIDRKGIINSNIRYFKDIFLEFIIHLKHFQELSLTIIHSIILMVDIKFL